MDNGGHFPFRAVAPYKLLNDSGAILVGAGRSPIWGVQARSAEYDSNYGFRVDLQGWGDSVVTTGYGNLYNLNGPDWFYTFDFPNTSSATAIVAGAVASVQGRSRVVHSQPSPPRRSKSSLIPAPRKPARTTSDLCLISRGHFPKSPLAATTSLHQPTCIQFNRTSF